MDITFRISEREKVVPVRIINDDIAERSERFTVMIQPVEGLFRVAVLDNLTTVDIIDDDRKFRQRLQGRGKTNNTTPPRVGGGLIIRRNAPSHNAAKLDPCKGTQRDGEMQHIVNQALLSTA